MNKYQLGTVMPGQAPAQFQYKPLGLEAFARPLAMKQQAYDQAFDAIDSAEFDIKGLNPDSISAQKLQGEMNKHKDALLEELDKTSNYRDAARKLKELNKIYNKDEEIVGIRTQRANFLEAEKEMRERIDGKTYTQDDFEKWRTKRLGEYAEQGGYNYDRATGDHNTINTDLRGANLESEVMGLAYKAANATPLQIQEFTGQWGDMDPETKQLIETLYKERDYEQVSAEVAKYLRQSDRYKTWIEEKAEYDWYYDSRKSGDVGAYSDDEMKNTFTALSDAAKYYTDVINDPEASKEIKAQAKAGLEDANSDIKDLTKLYQDAVNNGTLPQLAEATYKHNAVNNYIGDVSDAASDLFDVQQITNTLHTRENSGYKGAKEKVDKIDGMVVDQVTNTASVENKISVQGGGTGATTPTTDNEDEQIFLQQQELMTDLKWAHNDGRENELLTTSTELAAASTNPYKDSELTIDAIHQDAQDFHTLYAREDKWDKKISGIAAEITELTQGLSTGTEEERRDKRAQIKRLNEDLIESKVSRTGEFYYLDQLIKKAGTSEPWLKEMLDNKTSRRDIFKEMYDRSIVSMENFVQNQYQNSPDYLVNPVYDAEGNQVSYDLEYVRDIATERATVADDPIDPLRYSPPLPESEADVMRREMAVGQGAMGGILEDFRTEMAAKGAAVPTEVPVNDRTNAFLGGGEKGNSSLGNAIDYIKTQHPGSPGAGTVVKFDGQSGEVTKLTDEEQSKYLNYDLDYYSTPTYAGTSQEAGSNQLVLRFSRPDMGAPEIRKKIAALDADRDADDISETEVAAFKADNPKDLYLSLEGTSFNVGDDAMKTFTEFGESALAVNNQYKFNQMLQSYAAIDVISNSDRRADYNEMTTSLVNMMETKNTDRRVTQPPLYWQDNGNGTRSGYTVDYQYSAHHGRIVANVSMITLQKGVDYSKGSAQPAVKPMYTLPLDQPNMVNLRAMDITFGVGDERDTVTNPQRTSDIGPNVFVPAFFKPEMFADMANKY